MKIFICGTENINKKTLYNQLPYDVVSVIDNIIKESADIIIGDCFGIYELVQKYLNSTGYRNVKSLCKNCKFRDASTCNFQNKTTSWGSPQFPLARKLLMIPKLILHWRISE